MPIATSKSELLTAMTKEYDKLNKTLSELSDGEMCQTGVCHAWSTKDVLAHLAAWATMFFDWYERGMKGETFQLPAADLKWNQIPELNDRIYRRWKEVPLTEVRSAFETMHEQLVAFAQEVPEDRLFVKKLYPWMSPWPLSRWIAAVSSSHYSWANKRIRTFINTGKTPR